MSNYVLFNNGITFATWGNQTLDGLITTAIDESNLQWTEDYMKIMWFQAQQALNPQQVFSGRAGLRELDQISEGSVFPEMDVTKLDDKWFQIKLFGNKISATKLMTNWFKQNQRLKGADSSVIQNLDNFFGITKDLIRSAQDSLELEMVKVWTEGLNPISTAFWPWSGTPKLKPLFSQSHTAVNWTQLFANVAPFNIALTGANLQAALNLMKITLLENGRFHRRNNATYKLFVSRVNEVVARGILNDLWQLVQYSGTGTNANQANTFRFKGNMVEIVCLDWLWQRDKNGNMIGTNDYWFLTNPDILDETGYFKNIKLQDPEMSTYIANDTKNQIVDLSFDFACDHYGAEIAIFGSKGDGSASNA